MEAVVEDATTVTVVSEDGLRVDDIMTLADGSVGVQYVDQHCDLKDVGPGQDDGEVLLVQGLNDFPDVVTAETVVVDDSRAPLAQPAQPAQPGMAGRAGAYQQYQPMVVQGYLTSSGEVVHVVQQDAGRTVQHQPYPYQHQMMHPDLFRLVKMFPDFSTKTLHRIFVMCHCDLKRALDQALFARQFRQLDNAASYSTVAPRASPHFHPSPYRVPARPGPAPPPYMQVGVVGADVYLPRGSLGLGATRQAQPVAQAAAQSPILLYQQADPRLNKSLSHPATSMSLDGALGEVGEVVEIKLGDSLSDDALDDGFALAALEETVDGSGDGLHCSKDTKGLTDDLDGVAVKNSAKVGEVVTSQTTIVC